jgi:anti-sigma B factor antagonist
MSRSPGVRRVVPGPRRTAGQPLTVTRDRTGRSIRCRLIGELDAYSSDLLDRSLRTEEREGCDEIILDLEDLVFVDSTGLRTLIEAASRAQGGGWSVRVINARGKVRRVFDLTDMDSILAYCQKTALLPEY